LLKRRSDIRVYGRVAAGFHPFSSLARLEELLARETDAPTNMTCGTKEE